MKISKIAYFYYIEYYCLIIQSSKLQFHQSAYSQKKKNLSIDKRLIV